MIFVRWGFSWPHEAEGAQAAVDTVDELRALLLVGDPEHEPEPEEPARAAASRPASVEVG